MSWRELERRTRMDILRGILLVGWTSAVTVYFTAADPAAGPLGDPQQDSKIYRRTMQMVGGEANLVASDITGWVTGLWHGRTLGWTLAVLTVAVACGFFLMTEDLSPKE